MWVCAVGGWVSSTEIGTQMRLTSEEKARKSESKGNATQRRRTSEEKAGGRKAKNSRMNTRVEKAKNKTIQTNQNQPYSAHWRSLRKTFPAIIPLRTETKQPFSLHA